MTQNAANVFVLNRERSEQANACQHCMRRSQCPAVGHAGPESAVIQQTVKGQQALFKAGDTFKGIYIVRSGFFKSSFVESDGVIQVTGFHFPGDVVGIEGIDAGHYGDTVEALDTGSLCRIPLAFFAEETRTGHDEKAPPATGQLLNLVRIMGRAIAHDRRMIFSLGKMCARRRFTTFLLDVSRRMERSGYSADDFRLCMSRTDIANYLCLALETVSRLFSQLHNLGLVQVDRRNLTILDREALTLLSTDSETDTHGLKKAG